MAFQSSMNTYYVWIHTLYLQGMDSYQLKKKLTFIQKFNVENSTIKKKVRIWNFFNMSIISLDFWI